MKKHLKIRKIFWTVHALASGMEIPSKNVCSVNLLGLYITASYTKIKELKEKLELSLSDKKLSEKDKDQNADLLKWLKKQSIQSLIDWFDCIELTSLRSEDGTVTQRSGDTKGDRLFFTLLGIPGFEEKP